MSLVHQVRRQAAVLAGLIAPVHFSTGGSLDLSPGNARLIAGLVAALWTLQWFNV